MFPYLLWKRPTDEDGANIADQRLFQEGINREAKDSTDNKRVGQHVAGGTPQPEQLAQPAVQQNMKQDTDR
jgi:hypothetical protein